MIKLEKESSSDLIDVTLKSTRNTKKKIQKQRIQSINKKCYDFQLEESIKIRPIKLPNINSNMNPLRFV